MTRRSNSHFQRGSAAFKCGCCHRMTRHTGVQSIGIDNCPQCFDLAGLDNLLNDCPDERIAANYARAQVLLAEIAAKGGDAPAVRDQFEYAFPREVES